MHASYAIPSAQGLTELLGVACMQDRVAVDEAHCVSQWGKLHNMTSLTEIVSTGACWHAGPYSLELIRHCACLPGHDFRPDYKGLSVFKRRYDHAAHEHFQHVPN